MELEFYDENGVLVDLPNYEPMERIIAEKFIQEDDCVLELGARLGTVSVVINKKLKNKKNQVSVEPDDRVWEVLEKNRSMHNCEFNIVKGFISNRNLNLTNLETGAGSTYIEDSNTQIKSFTMDEVKSEFNIEKFNVLFADCEGGLELFLDENPNLYEDLRLVIFECDYEEKCNYNKIQNNLVSNGFHYVYGDNSFQKVWIK